MYVCYVMYVCMNVWMYEENQRTPKENHTIFLCRTVQNRVKQSTYSSLSLSLSRSILVKQRSIKLLWEYSLCSSSSFHLLLLLLLHLAILSYTINPLSCGKNTSSCTLSGFSLLVGDLSNEQIPLLSTHILNKFCYIYTHTYTQLWRLQYPSLSLTVIAQIWSPIASLSTSFLSMKHRL